MIKSFSNPKVKQFFSQLRHTRKTSSHLAQRALVQGQLLSLYGNQGAALVNPQDGWNEAARAKLLNRWLHTQFKFQNIEEMLRTRDIVNHELSKSQEAIAGQDASALRAQEAFLIHQATLLSFNRFIVSNFYSKKTLELVRSELTKDELDHLLKSSKEAAKAYVLMLANDFQPRHEHDLQHSLESFQANLKEALQVNEAYLVERHGYHDYTEKLQILGLALYEKEMTWDQFQAKKNNLSKIIKDPANQVALRLLEIDLLLKIDPEEALKALEETEQLARSQFKKPRSDAGMPTSQQDFYGSEVLQSVLEMKVKAYARYRRRSDFMQALEELRSARAFVNEADPAEDLKLADIEASSFLLQNFTCLDEYKASLTKLIALHESKLDRLKSIENLNGALSERIWTFIWHQESIKSFELVENAQRLGEICKNDILSFIGREQEEHGIRDQKHARALQERGALSSEFNLEQFEEMLASALRFVVLNDREFKDLINHHFEEESLSFAAGETLDIERLKGLGIEFALGDSEAISKIRTLLGDHLEKLGDRGIDESRFVEKVIDYQIKPTETQFEDMIDDLNKAIKRKPLLSARRLQTRLKCHYYRHSWKSTLDDIKEQSNVQEEDLEQLIALGQPYRDLIREYLNIEKTAAGERVSTDELEAVLMVVRDNLEFSQFRQKKHGNNVFNRQEIYHDLKATENMTDHCMFQVFNEHGQKLDLQNEYQARLARNLSAIIYCWNVELAASTLRLLSEHGEALGDEARFDSEQTLAKIKSEASDREYQQNQVIREIQISGCPFAKAYLLSAPVMKRFLEAGPQNKEELKLLVSELEQKLDPEILEEVPTMARVLDDLKAVLTAYEKQTSSSTSKIATAALSASAATMTWLKARISSN